MRRHIETSSSGTMYDGCDRSDPFIVAALGPTGLFDSAPGTSAPVIDFPSTIGSVEGALANHSFSVSASSFPGRA